jgi:DNA-directed RNA polymerase subunit RPC12/RpoP
MKSTGRSKTLRKGSTCPRCNSGKLVPIVYGLPGRELMEQSERGEVELGGCVVTQVIDHNGIRTSDPELHCPACSSKFYRSGAKHEALHDTVDGLEDI